MASKYTIGTIHTVPARSGVAVPLRTNQTITVINQHGTQVVDFWYVVPHTNAPSPGNPIQAYMSMCHSRASTLHLSPRPGDVMVDNRRQPILEFVSDTTTLGIHDTLIAACDIHRYHELGVPKDVYHDNCSDNYHRGLSRDAGIAFPSETDMSSLTPPDPLNLFMNIPVVPRAKADPRDENEVKNVTAGGAVVFEKPVCRPGDRVTLRALRDGIAVMSACPQDILTINNQNPTDAAFIVEEAS